MLTTQVVVWQVVLYFHPPISLGRWSNLTNIFFSDGLVQPPTRTSTFKGVPTGSLRVSIHHPLGFIWHPFEGAGRRYLSCLAYSKLGDVFLQKNPVQSARSVSPKVPFEVPAVLGEEKISGQGGMSGKFLSNFCWSFFRCFFWGSNGDWLYNSLKKRWTQEQVRRFSSCYRNKSFFKVKQKS